MTSPTKRIQLHRNRDTIAVQGEDFSLYLTAGMCHMLAKALQDGAIDILTTKRPESKFPETILTSGEATV